MHINLELSKFITIAVFVSEYVANLPHIQCMALSFVLVCRRPSRTRRYAAPAATPRTVNGSLCSAE
jgi:hypothetical protein